MMALVRLEMRFSMSFGSRVSVSFTSAKTMLAPSEKAGRHEAQ